jgi:hypothetical protein
MTQPLPNPVSWLAHQLPLAIHQLSTGITLGLELVLPLAMLGGRRGRGTACLGFVVLMGMLFITGNFGWFQLLAVVLCTTLLDERDLARWIPTGWLQEATGARMPNLGLPLAAVWLTASLLLVPSYARWPLPVPLAEAMDTLAPLRSANRYGLFAVMTTQRPEIVIEGTRDGEHWQPYELPYKPGNPDRRPGFAAPHMPRLDWQLWFAALSRCERHPFVAATMVRLLEGSGPVRGLFEVDPFPDQPPIRVRTVRYDYRFGGWGSAAWWERSNPRPYCPELAR